MTIYEALKDIELPVCHPPYAGDCENYVTYQLLGQDGQIYAEGSEGATAVTYAVNLFMNLFNASLITLIKEALERAGYIVVVEMENYNDEKVVNQVSMIATIEGAQYG